MDRLLLYTALMAFAVVMSAISAYVMLRDALRRFVRECKIQWRP